MSVELSAICDVWRLHRAILEVSEEGHRVTHARARLDHVLSDSVEEQTPPVAEHEDRELKRSTMPVAAASLQMAWVPSPMQVTHSAHVRWPSQTAFESTTRAGRMDGPPLHSTVYCDRTAHRPQHCLLSIVRGGGDAPSQPRYARAPTGTPRPLVMLCVRPPTVGEVVCDMYVLSMAEGQLRVVHVVTYNTYRAGSYNCCC